MLKNKLNLYILLLLKQPPHIGMLVITLFAIFFAVILSLVIAYITDTYFYEYELSFYQLTALSAVIIPIIITPFLSYHLLHASYERNNLISKLDYTSKYDSLTNLKNRRYTLELANKELILAKKNKLELSIILFDYDYFNDINDYYGHYVGDLILKIFSNILNNNIRKSDILGRYGEDKFILICTHTNSRLAYKMATKIKNKLNKDLSLLNFEITMSTSVGCSTFDYNKDITIENIIYRAYTSLQKAKILGRNRVEQI